MAGKYDNDFSLELPLLVSKFKNIEDKLNLDIDGEHANFEVVFENCEIENINLTGGRHSHFYS